MKHKNLNLIEDGWLTIDEFMAKLTPGLKEYLESNWRSSKDDIHHPGDLATTASIYLDIASRVLQEFPGCHHNG
jgi:hypothetical protein